MADEEWARTERRAPVFDAEELAAAAHGQAPAAKKEREVGAGPAWAGTLPKLDAPQAPAQPVGPAPVPAAMQPVAQPVYRPANNPLPPVEDVAPTHYELPAEKPRPLPPAPAPGSDLPLMIALGLVGVAIVLVLVGVVIAVFVGL
jgi:hypothetical protein